MRVYSSVAALGLLVSGNSLFLFGVGAQFSQYLLSGGGGEFMSLGIQHFNLVNDVSYPIRLVGRDLLGGELGDDFVSLRQQVFKALPFALFSQLEQEFAE